MKTLKEALFSRKNIYKSNDIDSIIENGGCIIIHDYEYEEGIIIYNTYNEEILYIFRSSDSNCWDITNGYIDNDIKDFIRNKCDLYTIEGYNDERQWPKLRSVFFYSLGKPLSFRPIEFFIRDIKKYNMELCPIMT